MALEERMVTTALIAAWFAYRRAQIAIWNSGLTAIKAEPELPSPVTVILPVKAHPNEIEHSSRPNLQKRWAMSLKR